MLTGVVCEPVTERRRRLGHLQRGARVAELGDVWLGDQLQRLLAVCDGDVRVDAVQGGEGELAVDEGEEGGRGAEWERGLGQRRGEGQGRGGRVCAAAQDARGLRSRCVVDFGSENGVQRQLPFVAGGWMDGWATAPALARQRIVESHERPQKVSRG